MIVFNYSSSVSVEETEENSVIIRVQRIDTHQEIYMRMEVELPEATIKNIEAKFLRCPGGDCPQTAERLQTLVGKSLSRGISRSLKEGVLGPHGCAHLGEMVMDAARSLVQAKFTMRAIELGYDEHGMQKELDDSLKNTCHQYTVGWRPHRLCED
ncbi:MAG: DUF2889 domain-containing protein [Bacillota bacterium]|nr:DUF2889 domain-containing protein [Bacillota bacterium]